MIFYYLSIALILCVGFLIVKKDLRFKKISNKVIVAGFLSGLGLLSLSWLLGYADLDYIEKTFINALLALITAFLIWRLEFWPAGDAKFFALMAFLLPLYFYRNAYLVFFPSFALLCNIFVAFLIFVIFKTGRSLLGNLFYFLKAEDDKIIFFKKYFAGKREWMCESFKNKKIIGQIILKSVVQLVVALVFYFIIAKFILHSQFSLISAIIFLLAFKLVSAGMNFYTQKYSCEKINAMDIKIGDNLEKSQFLNSKSGEKMIEALGRLRPEGLENFQVEILKEYFSKNGVMEVIIHKTIPFSIWILFGVLLTVLFNGIVEINFW